MLNKKYTRGLLAAPVLAISLSSSPLSAEQTAQWSYQGDTGPEHWAELSTDYSLCTNGKNQSPIDIDPAEAMSARKSGIKFNYGVLQPKGLTHTGKHLQLDVEEGANIALGDKQYALKHLKLHMPSENTLNQRHFPMEIEFVHESADQGVLNVSLMVIPGRENRMLAKLIESLPIKAGETKAVASHALRSLEMKKKLANYYYYSGSMTAPPCREGVRWYIMQEPVTMSAEQQQALKQALGEDNNRPVQPLNARMVLK